MEHLTQDLDLVTIFGLLRHGETKWNTQKKIQGWGDSPLTEKGKEKTGEWAEILQPYGWDRIIASDLGRVKETVAVLNRTLNLPVSFDERLREQHWGDWEGLTIPTIKECFKEELTRRVGMGWDFSAPGGESRLAVRQRVLAALSSMAKEWPGRKILVVCHQGVIKTVLYFLTARAFVPGEDPLLQHNCLHLISCSGEQFSPVQLNISPGPSR